MTSSTNERIFDMLGKIDESVTEIKVTQASMLADIKHTMSTQEKMAEDFKDNEKKVKEQIESNKEDVEKKIDNMQLKIDNQTKWQRGLIMVASGISAVITFILIKFPIILTKGFQ